MKISLLGPIEARLRIARNRKLHAAALLCASLLVADLILHIAVMRPLWTDLRVREAANAELRSRYTAAAAFQKQRKALAGTMFSVPAQKDMPLLIKELVQAARGCNLRIESVKYDIPRTGAGGISPLSFSFPAEGRYGDLKRFIHDVETSRRLIGIKALEFKSGRGTVDLDLKLVTYVRYQ